MEIIGFEYANGTHYCNKEKSSGGNYEKILIVSPCGNIQFFNNYTFSDIPTKSANYILYKSAQLRDEFMKKWEQLTIFGKYMEIADRFSVRGGSYANDFISLKYQDYVAKYEKEYIETL